MKKKAKSIFTIFSKMSDNYSKIYDMDDDSYEKLLNYNTKTKHFATNVLFES
jgi:hypothetical protein